MFKRRIATAPEANLPKGHHDGILTNVVIQRRQATKPNKCNPPINYSGWDLVDQVTCQLIAEFNDETAPPLQNWQRYDHKTRTTNEGINGNELNHLFQAIHTLCMNTAMDALRTIGHALPEHEHSPTGTVIATIAFGASVTLPETAKLTRKQAYQQGYASASPIF